MKCDKDDPVMIPCTSALEPALTAEHGLLRVSFCLTKIDPATRLYDDYYQSIHVDEKWFFISEKALRLYIAPDEIVPQRRCQNKDHILKVMFLAAVACPRFNAQGECTFNGKIGMSPFVERVSAQRASRNCSCGHIETKLLPVNKNRYREFKIQKVIPSIQDNCPCRNRNIVIQQDGASSHIAENDPEFVAAATEGLWNISLLTQLPKLPHLNVLNLSFFRAFQSHQWRNGFANNLDEPIMSVEQASETFEPRKLDFGFLTLQCCIDDVL
jgi:hypothetical protein